MSITSRGLRFGSGFAVVIFSLATFASTCFGQSLVGFEFGVGQNTQQGTFMCDCGAAFNGGKGMGWDGSAFFELPFAPDLFAGIKAGIDRKNTSITTGPENEAGFVETNTGQIDTVVLPMNLTGTLTMSLLSLQPFIQYQVLHSDFFVQVGARISDLTSSNFTQTREMTSNSITFSDGTTISPLVFTNGTHKEEVQYGPLPSATRLLFSGILSAGYNFVSGRMSLAPMVTYDYPFSSPQGGGAWKIASLYGSLAVGF